MVPINLATVAATASWAAVPLAVALYDPEFRALAAREAGPDGWDVGIVLSGGNVSLEALGRLFADDEQSQAA